MPASTDTVAIDIDGCELKVRFGYGTEPPAARCDPLVSALPPATLDHIPPGIPAGHLRSAFESAYRIRYGPDLAVVGPDLAFVPPLFQVVPTA